jgi:putative spermidine/putrescine transport system substrate-binding protein
VLKGGAAIAGATAITGFPTVWAQSNITLNHTGMSYSTIADIARQASQDLGITVEMSVVDHPGLLNRMVNDPNSIDIADMEIWQTKVAVPQGVTQAVEIAKIKNWGQLTPLYTEGTFAGKEVSRQGDAPIEYMYRDAKDATTFAAGKTDWATFVPSVYNADTLGIRPDLTGRQVTSRADLLSPDFKGKTAIQNIPTNGIMDAMMAMEAAGEMKYGDKGNPTQDELTKTIARLVELKKAGHFRALWNTFDESVNLMASGEVVIQSMWSPAVSAVRARGIPCAYQPLKEGFRGWGYTFGIMKHLTGLKRDCALEYANWYGAGFQGAFIARQGYYSAQPENARRFLTPAEWDYWYDGKPAATDLPDPFGRTAVKAGEVRDGGSFSQRMGNIAVWNSVMDEDRYLTRKWNEFIAS